MTSTTTPSPKPAVGPPDPGGRAGIGRVTIDAEPWTEFVDPDGRLTTPAKVLSASQPCILLVEFGPDLHVDAHSHPYDTLYIPLRGEVDFGDDGEPPLMPGQIRWVEGGKVYGPEVGGPEGAEILVISMEGEVRIDWADGRP